MTVLQPAGGQKRAVGRAAPSRSAGPLALLRHQGKREPFGAAQHVERDGLADLLAGQRANEIIGAGDRHPVEGEQEVAGSETGAVGALPDSTVAAITALSCLREAA
jgi:hypothetical protein